MARTSRTVARRLLRKRIGEIDRKGRVVGPSAENVAYGDLERLLIDDYGAREVVSLKDVQSSVLPHLRRAFSAFRAVEIRPAMLTVREPDEAPRLRAGHDSRALEGAPPHVRAGDGKRRPGDNAEVSDWPSVLAAT